MLAKSVLRYVIVPVLVLLLSGYALSQVTQPTRPSLADLSQRQAAIDAPKVASPGRSKVIGGVQLFPSNNFRYADVSQLPVRADSSARIAGTLDNTGRFGDIGYPQEQVHADFGTDFGMPYVVVGLDQPLVPITGWNYSYSQAESIPYPSAGEYRYPIPLDAPMETNSDRHIIVVQPSTNLLFEIWDPRRVGDGYAVGLITVWDLNSNAALPDGQTSADAAGLPILSGLFEASDVADGEVNHSCRMTVDYPDGGYEWPGNHVAEQTADTGTRMLMGTWVRLRADADLSSLGTQATVIARAMQRYGCQIIDVGPNWKISGVPSADWDNVDLQTLHSLEGSDFEVVDTSSIRVTTIDRAHWLEVMGAVVAPPPGDLVPPTDDPSLPAIVVDQPTPGQVVGHEFLASGTSNTFEATHMVRVVSGSSIVAEQVVTATCGTGCRGTWQVVMELPAAVTGPATFQAFEFSAQDGSIVNLVEIPIVVDQQIVLPPVTTMAPPMPTAPPATAPPATAPPATAPPTSSPSPSSTPPTTAASVPPPTGVPATPTTASPGGEDCLERDPVTGRCLIHIK